MSSPRPLLSADRALAILLGLQGLALMVVFPLGPQEARLWHPGVPGVAALAAAFPLTAVFAGLLARRARRLPASPRALAALGLGATLPCLFSFDYPSLVAARMFAGLAAGISGVALHRDFSASSPLSPHVVRMAPRIVAFGLPACIFAANCVDWRFAFLPIALGFLVVLIGATSPHLTPAAASHRTAEPAPSGVVAAGALAFVTAAYLTVLSGYLVFNAGHTETLIPLVLLTAALLGLAVPRLIGRLRARTSPRAFYTGTLAVSLVTLFPLLALQSQLAAPAAVAAIALFLVANSTRHLALAQLVSTHLPPGALAVHQLHVHLAHLGGTALGAVTAGRLISLAPERTLSGMPSLLLASLFATAMALVAGLAAAQRKASPAA